MANAASDSILRAYKLIPVIVPHYDAIAATLQKINALASRTAVQARDIFDLYVLNSKLDDPEINSLKTPRKEKLERAYENLFSVTFGQFRDSVVSFLSPDEQTSYNSSIFWDEIKLKAVNLLEQLIKRHD